MNDFTFDALANGHRRTLLVELFESRSHEDTIHVPTDRDSRADDPDRQRMALYHTHLPKLVDYGFVRWNENTHEICRGSRFEEIRPLLEVVVDCADGELVEQR
ncbi:DUF7344 domain-containing protein [Halorarum halophilum]